MMKSSRKNASVAGLLMALAAGVSGYAQDITPVDIDREKPEQPRLHYYDRHGERLAEPVLFVLDTDTVKRPGIKSPWPLFNGVDVGVNFFDGVLLAAGQSYASFDLSARVSLHNWFFPVVEAGLGFADTHPEDSNFHYESPLSPYLKVGLDYNFLYKSSPDYQVFLGARLGVAKVNYSIRDISVNSSYWDESAGFDITGQHAVPVYGDVLAGLKVRLVGALSMGWTFRWHFRIHTPAATESQPWFIPGYGASSPVGATFSLIYTFGGKRSKEEAPAE